MTELKAVPHLVRPGVTVIEIWHNGVFIASITPSATLPAVTVISKYSMDVRAEEGGTPFGVTVQFL